MLGFHLCNYAQDAGAICGSKVMNDPGNPSQKYLRLGKKYGGDGQVYLHAALWLNCMTMLKFCQSLSDEDKKDQIAIATDAAAEIKKLRSNSPVFGGKNDYPEVTIAILKAELNAYKFDGSAPSNFTIPDDMNDDVTSSGNKSNSGNQNSSNNKAKQDLLAQFQKEQKQDKKEIKGIAKAANNIELDTVNKKKKIDDQDLFAAPKVYAPAPGQPSPDPIDPAQFIAAFNAYVPYVIDPTNSVRIRYTLDPRFTITGNEINLILWYSYENIRRDGKYVIAWGNDLNELENRRYISLNPSNKLSHIEFNVAFGGKLADEDKRLRGAPTFFTPNIEICNLALPPGITVGLFNKQLSIHRGTANIEGKDVIGSIYLYFNNLQKIQAYQGFAGFREREVFNNRLVRITCAMTPTGNRFNGSFINRPGCTEVSSEYLVIINFQNVSGHRLGKKSGNITSNLVFDAPQYFGPGLTFSSLATAEFNSGAIVPSFVNEYSATDMVSRTFPERPHQLINVPALLPSLPGQQLQSNPFRVYVSNGVPVWFLPSIDVLSYTDDIYIIQEQNSAAPPRECYHAVVWYQKKAKCNAPVTSSGLASEPYEIDFQAVTNVVSVPSNWGGPAYKPAGMEKFIDRDRSVVERKRMEILSKNEAIMKKYNCKLPVNADALIDQCN